MPLPSFSIQQNDLKLWSSTISQVVHTGALKYTMAWTVICYALAEFCVMMWFKIKIETNTLI